MSLFYRSILYRRIKHGVICSSVKSYQLFSKWHCWRRLRETASHHREAEIRCCKIGRRSGGIPRAKSAALAAALARICRYRSSADRPPEAEAGIEIERRAEKTTISGEKEAAQGLVRRK